ncbi:MAG: tRNA uridine-5-carboxymethylaminomethyl(34) synthesis GTPase MnmE [Saprospirales bacterium]|nr:tRNA uridine-5-carboxymethylaminomethyl(34) synthesis GTPase MnmE [Saprospirales bacterium]
MLRQETIVALASPEGMGAIHVIRMSGEEAIAIANECFQGTSLLDVPSHSAHYGYFVDRSNAKAIQRIDEVLITVFRSPKSFTTEDCVEISCHGSMVIAQKIINTLIQAGAVPAEAGEFTLRAFLHGRIDLTQAEAVADLIASKSEHDRTIALNQMRGGFRNQLKNLRSELVKFKALVELELDFGEEDVEFAERQDLLDLIAQIRSVIKPLAESFTLGNVIKEGLVTVIAGKPNAGKSTLLNALLRDNRAIVSNIAGTTRDTIEEVIQFEGFRLRLIDTAGLRESDDIIEQVGVAKAKEELAKAQLMLYVFDAGQESPHSVRKHVESLNHDSAVILIGNKMDECDDTEVWQEAFPESTLVSLTQEAEDGISLIQDKIIAVLQGLGDIHSDVILTNSRHVYSLKEALASMEKVEQALKLGLTGDLLSSDIQQSLNALGNITGEVTNDEVLGYIFSKFCIGK